MKFNNKNSTAFGILLVYCANSFAGQYYGSPIDRKATQIKTKFINQPSGSVAAKNNPSLSDDFKGFLADDKIMQKIKKINVEGSSATTLEVTDLEENITENWLQKENDLQVKRNNCLPKQMGYGLLLGGGLLAAVVAANKKPSSKESAIVAGAGAFAVLGAGVGLLMMAGEKGRLEKHIAQVQIMKKDWNAFFGVSDQK